MSCIPGVPDFSFFIGDLPTIRFPTFNVNGNFNHNIKMNLNKTNKSLSLRDMIAKSNLKFPLPHINGLCEDYIRESLDFKNDDIGGLRWTPLCITLKTCKKCTRTLFGRVCIPYPCGFNPPSYSLQPYWTNQNIKIPNKTILNFDLPSIEIGMNIDIKSALTISGCIQSPYAFIIDDFNSYLLKNQGSFSITLLVDFIKQAIPGIITNVVGNISALIVIWDILTITLDITITNCYIKVGNNQIDIPDFNIKKTVNILGENGRFLFLEINPPADISFNINVLSIDVWEYVVDTIVKNLNLASRLTTILGPLLSNLLGNFTDEISSGTKPVTDWLRDHLAIIIDFFGRMCPLNPPGTQFLICSRTTAVFTPFTQSEMNIITNKVNSGITETTNALEELKIPSQANALTKSTLSYLGFQRGKGFNETIDDASESLEDLFKEIIGEIITEITSLNFTVIGGLCIIPPI
jgi:hypothetical protein